MKLKAAEKKASDVFDAGLSTKKELQKLLGKVRGEHASEISDLKRQKGKIQSNLDKLRLTMQDPAKCECLGCTSIREAAGENKGYAERMIGFIRRKVDKS